MAGSPTEIANLAIDALGKDAQLGDLEEGGRVANLMLRSYLKCFNELMRAAPWTFARKQEPLVLLADASGNTANVGTTVPGTNFQYEYLYPVDCARIRYIPWNPFQNAPVPTGNITPANPTSPLTTGAQSPQQLWQPIRPSLFLVTNDPNFPSAAGSNAPFVQGQSPIGSTVILSNVQNASLVYTFQAVYPSLWDPLFTGAMVAYLASEVALGIWSDNPKMGMALRPQQIAVAKEKIMQARIADGNEMSVSTSHIPDWIKTRMTGGGSGFGGGWGWGGGAGSYGCWGLAWGGSMSFSDGSSY